MEEKIVLFLSTNMAAMTSHANHQLTCRTNFINYFNVFWVNFVVFHILDILEFGATELNSTFETTALPMPGQIDLSSARQ